jgi:uncharacterized protein VirK/YbjX
VGQTRLLRGGALLKRVRQVAYLGSHPLSHYRCATVIRDSRLTSDPFIPLKYLGNHLALSLRTPQRREALMGHYDTLPKLLHPAAGNSLSDGLVIWQRLLPGDAPPLSVVLESSKLAPMEGELQLRFSFRSDLYVLTFLLAPGHIFDLDCARVLFIGGVQGRIGSREEMREASKHNCEISPAAMLILSVQAIGKIMRVDELIAIGEDDHISMGYSPSKIMFDYRRFWTEVGGERLGAHYRLPMHTPQKPLAEVPLAHRSRTRRKREAKQLVRVSIERRLRQVVMPGLDRTSLANAESELETVA